MNSPISHLSHPSGILRRLKASNWTSRGNNNSREWSRPPDLLPCIRTKLSMICAKERGRGYVEEQAHGSADDRGAQTTGSRTQGGRRGARSRRVEAHDLRLESEVRRDGRESGAGSEAVAG